MSLKNIRFLVTISCLVLASTFGVKAISTHISNNNVYYQDSKPVKHTVGKGDTVYSIAQLYGITVADVYTSNPSATNGIKLGEVLTIPNKKGNVSQSSQGTVIKTYTVRPKETLYSIAKENGVKIEDIIDANPELNSRPLYDGQILRMPSANKNTSTTVSSSSLPKTNNKFITHKVEAKETLYGISQQYSVTPEAIIDFNPDLNNGLKIGQTLVIPILETSTGQATLLDNVNKISVGVVLPFVNKSDGQTARFIEYYEGFLLALAEMKSKGFSANVYTFDMGSEAGIDKLKSLLDTYEMKSLDLIIGGVSPEQVEVISEFAKKEGVKYVIPFPTKVSGHSENAEIFQINAPHTVLYENVSNTFVNLFPSANIIYITENGIKGDRADFIDVLDTKLLSNGMLSTSVSTGLNMKAVLSSVLDANRKNIIVPTSASSKMLASILPTLNSIRVENPATNITLFGHTDWQTYKQYTKEYGKYDTYIYTPFFFDINNYKSKQFVDNYKKWYNKSMINTYPRYAVLGYDTGLSFLTALQKYGKNFNSNVNSLSGNSLQTPFLFKKGVGLDGYMNNGFYIVRYNTDGSIDKTEYGR